MRMMAVGGCVIPFLLPSTDPLARAVAAILTWLFAVKAFQYVAGHERPIGFANTLLFLTIPAVVRWESPYQPGNGRAVRALLTSVVQLGLAGLIVMIVLQFDSRHPVQLLTTQFGIYLGLAGACNLAVIPLALRRLDYVDPFDNPMAARTPGEFWGRRWNTWVSHMLFRYVFVPAGGWRRPVMGTLATFGVSGAIHEGFMIVGTGRVTGWMGGFFLVQGLIVIVTARPVFRRLARQRPWISWAITLLLLLVTGPMLVRGADGVDPSNAWRRCCSLSSNR
jgi:hypothetical protein